MEVGNLGYILTILSGIILTIPFDYPQLFFLSWIGLLPFLVAIRQSMSDRGFIMGWLLGITIFLRSCYWLYYPVVLYSGLPWLLCFFLLLALFLLLGLIYGLWGWVYIYVARRGVSSPVWLAISWTGLEYLRYRLFPILSFGFIGYTQSSFKQLIQLAEIGGLFLLTFLVLLLNGYFYKLFIRKKGKVILPISLIMIIILSYGNIQINHYEKLDAKHLNVGVVQSNLTPDDKWKVANIEKNMEYLLKHTLELEDIDLIIWPESSLTFDIMRNEYYRNKFLQEFAKIDKFIQMGSLAVDLQGDDLRYNSSFLLTPELSFQQRYNKIKLVPFGEYLPLSSFVRYLIDIKFTDEKPGSEIVIFKTALASWKTAICSEILYPHFLQEKIGSVYFIVNQSNEAWYQTGNLQEQMWIAAIFRAVENRRTIIKAGNYAYGGFIAPSGLPIIKGHSRTARTLSARVPLYRGKTLYQQWGDYIAYISLGITLLLLSIRFILNLKERR